jgi:Transposase DDE domain group 1
MGTDILQIPAGLKPGSPLPGVRGNRQSRIAAGGGKNAIEWMRLSCRAFAANAFRLQLHALAYNPGNFIRTLAIPKTAGPWSLTSLRGNLIKIGAKVVSYGRYVTFQMAEVAAPRQMFANILSLIARLRPPPARPHDRRRRVRRLAAVSYRLRSPLDRGEGVFRCPNRSKTRTWPPNSQESGECRPRRD